ncbi:DUF2892 domain-containing protein [Magnetospira sp. QH-2]|uniref:YgaP family membrane protein n=1 Tax=Magnetospira sp. (strain QH-2) TaxID=1288970 RepID=UPI0003E80DBE|nr:DUF2892 domain-containing protein [Magnetospira sp. QH-2]CCQ73645.1 Conserved protein of unknown function [Magnetospira sp. QH-2]
MNAFTSFMASPAGRLIRIFAGGALVTWGIWGIGGTDGMIIAALGTGPMLTGLFNICLVGPLFGCPLRGSKARTGS